MGTKKAKPHRPTKAAGPARAKKKPAAKPPAEVRATILIIEDEAPLREAFEFLLQAEGFTVHSAENGLVALSVMKDIQPDVILLDMLMPVLNGLEFLQKAELAKYYPKSVVIALSNLSDSITLEDAALYGVTETILKATLSPVDLVKLVNKYAV